MKINIILRNEIKTKFKRIISFLLLLIISSYCLVYANSGPVLWPSFPSSDSLTIDENCPIEIRNENLVFDLSNSNNEHSGYSLAGNVIAEYEMYNPTGKPLIVNMAFPFVERLNQFSEHDVIIKEDNNVLPFQVYIGDTVQNYNTSFEEIDEDIFDFKEIVKTINDNHYKPVSFKTEEIGKLYKFSVKPKENSKFEFELNFQFDSNHTKIITKGDFTRFQRDTDKIKISSTIEESMEFEVYVLGRDIDININEDAKNSVIKTIENKDVKSYLLEYIDKDKFNYDFSDIQLDNMYTEAIDNILLYNQGFCSEDLLSDQSYTNRIVILLYSVEFPANSVKNVSVSYNTTGTMDRRDTNEPQYTFKYLLNPAENWNDFKNLSIKVITPTEAPYIINSSIEFIKEEDNVYTANLQSLPDSDLSFTLYHKDGISIFDRIIINPYYVYIIGYLLAIIGFVVLIVVLVKKVVVLLQKTKNK